MEKKGAFNMDTTFLKTYKDALAGPIVNLINVSIRQCIFPHSWKMAVVTPIFMAGDQTNVANYRPISILPVVSKVAEKWVGQQLTTHFSIGHTPLHPLQYGFRSNHSTETANCYFWKGLSPYWEKVALWGHHDAEVENDSLETSNIFCTQCFIYSNMLLFSRLDLTMTSMTMT